MSTSQTGLVLILVGLLLVVLAPLVARDERVILNIFRQLLGERPAGERAEHAFKWVRISVGGALVVVGIGLLILGVTSD